MPHSASIDGFRAFLGDRCRAYTRGQLLQALEIADRLRYPGQPRDSKGRFGEGKSDAAKEKEAAQKERVAQKAAAKSEHDQKKTAAGEASAKASDKGTRSAHDKAAKAHLAAADAALRAGRPAQAQAHSEAAAQHAGEVHRLKQEQKKQNEAVPFDGPSKPTELNPRTKFGQAINQAARENGLDAKHLADAAEYIHEMAVEKAGEREEAKAFARKLTGLTAADIGRLENSGHDYASDPKRVGGETGAKLKKFDVYADEVASHYPGVIGAANREHAQSESHSQALWDLIREGKQRAPQPHDKDVIQKAVEAARAHTPHSQKEEDFGEF